MKVLISTDTSCLINYEVLEKYPISVFNLNVIIDNQEYLKFVEVLETLDFIREKDMKVVFKLQEEAKKRFILDYSNVPRAERMFTNVQEKTAAELEDLKEENKKLRQQLNQLLQLVKK